MNFPTLYKKTSTGKIQMWRIEVIPKVDKAAYNLSWTEIHTTYGQLDGKQQTALDVITEGKNIGKANETTAFEQAISEAGSQWDKKKKKGYVESLEMAEKGAVDASVILGGAPVMLAHKFSEQGHKIKFPCYVQPKLDGHRCIAIVKDGKCTLWSRTQKKITGVPHIQRELERIVPDDQAVFDGELYNHDYRDRFEELSSFIRQEYPKPGHEVIEYWIYDVIENENWTFKSRNDILGIHESLHKNTNPRKIVWCTATEVEDLEELMIFFETARDIGFEGAMARNADGKYVGKRSYDLQKIKEFDDAEFEIVGVEEGRGNMAGKGIFVCATSDGAEFGAKMKGDRDELKKYWENPDDYIGRFVTVQYQGLTGKNGVPRFPVAIRLREDV